MENYPDSLPVTMPTRAFPMGPASAVQYKIDMIDSWIEEKGNYPYDRIVNYISYRSNALPHEGKYDKLNHEATQKLCRSWDALLGPQKRQTITGYMVARAFLQDTRILPKFDIDISDELERMQNNRENSGQVRSFARAAWAGMAHSHAPVHDQFQKLLSFSQRFFDIESDIHRDYFSAGIVLPYMVAVTTGLQNYANRSSIIGVKVGTADELSAMEFSQVFAHKQQ